MQAVAGKLSVDASGWVIPLTMYTDDVVFVNGAPPAGAVPYVTDTVHVPIGSTLAQANAAATAQVQKRHDEHAAIAAVAAQVEGHVISVPG